MMHPPGPDHPGPFLALPCCPCTYLDRNHAVCNERGFWHHPECEQPPEEETADAWRCSTCGDTETGADMPMRDCTGTPDENGDCGYWEPVEDAE